MTLEIQILDAIQSIRTPLGDVLMPAVSALGNSGAIWIVLTLVLLVCPKTRRMGAAMACALVLDLILCNGMLKPWIGRTRPFEINSAVQLLIAKPMDYSFPSGHTAASFAAACALYRAGGRRLAIPAFVLAGVIAFSRLYLYVHFSTDVIGGIAVGLVCGWLGYRCVVWYEMHRATRKGKKS
ncbi:MAG: phosphatase PAP2 family protein [Butyricicoccus sp.]